MQATERPWWQGAVIYQVYPRSFMDSNGDGVGDLAGIVQRLDHIADLGAEAVWLSPVFRSPMADMGYDVSDYTDIDPLFGTLADFDALIAAVHARGLRVIVDQVLNHCSVEHPYFVESRQSRTNPRADWFVWADPKHDGTPPNNWLSHFGGPAWTWEPRRRQYYLHNFHASQPDWNMHNPEVEAFLLSTMRFWLERGVDGFRLDTVNYFFHDKLLRDNPADPRRKTKPEISPYDMQWPIFSKSQPENLAFLERIRAVMDDYPDRTTVGEVGDQHRAIELMAAYTSGSKRLHMAYSFEMLGEAYTPAHFRRCVEEFFRGAPDGWPCWSFSNHDVERHASRWAAQGAGRAAVARQAAVLLAVLPGTICLYQGEELGLPEAELDYHELTDVVGKAFWPENKGRDGCRTPMVWEDAETGGFTTATPWLPVKPPHRALAVAHQAVDPDSVLGWYRRVLGWRRGCAALPGAAFQFLDALPDTVLALWRGTGAEARLFVFNLSPVPVALEAKGLAVAAGAPELSARLEPTAGNGAAVLQLGPSGCVALQAVGKEVSLTRRGAAG